MIATPTRQAIMNTPMKTTVVKTTGPFAFWTTERCGPEARSRELGLGAGGLGVEQGVHA
jgi:hypothetical protein